MKEIRRIYVAGPISIGDMAQHVRVAIDASTALLELGYYPFCPHLTHFWHLIHPQEYEKWMEYDFEWLGQCDALLRLPGESPGADREVEFAKKHNMPVFHTIEELKMLKDAETSGLLV